jgi:hypothetical protein
MGLGKRVAIHVARPIYRKFFERPLWWFLSKVKAFFFVETTERLLIIEHKLDRLEKLGNIDERLRNAEVSNAAQWDALEQLLLAMFRQRESHISDSDREDSTSQYTPICDATGSDRVNGPNALR